MDKETLKQFGKIFDLAYGRWFKDIERGSKMFIPLMKKKQYEEGRK